MLQVTGEKSGPDGAGVCATQVFSTTTQLSSQLVCKVPKHRPVHCTRKHIPFKIYAVSESFLKRNELSFEERSFNYLLRTYFLTYLLSYLFTYLITYFLTYLLIYLLNYLLSYFLTYLLIYLLT